MQGQGFRDVGFTWLGLSAKGWSSGFSGWGFGVSLARSDLWLEGLGGQRV